MTGPLDRPADPSTTPPMTDADVETLWAWPEGGLRIGEFNPPTAYGIAVLLREIERARAEITRLQNQLAASDKEEWVRLARTAQDQLTGEA